jgi:hypothetical protein
MTDRAGYARYCRELVGWGSVRPVGHALGWLSVRVLPARAASRARGGLAAAAVRLGDDLQQVTVGVFEVQAAAAVPVVDHPGLGLARICPVRQALAATSRNRPRRFPRVPARLKDRRRPDVPR